jgi:hypothetical protein
MVKFRQRGIAILVFRRDGGVQTADFGMESAAFTEIPHHPATVCVHGVYTTNPLGPNS